jgi:death-on-curing protein
MIVQKLRRVGNSYVVTIPKDEVERRGLRVGQALSVEVQPVEIDARPVMSQDVREAFERSWKRPDMERYLSLGEVLALHHAVMERTGGASQGLRDEGALESAIMRPRMLAHYTRADLIEQASVLIAGIAQAQAFVVGNKRTAFAAGEVFLDLNGMQYFGEPLDLARQLELIAERTDSLEAATARFADWLRGRVQPSGPTREGG